MVLIEGKKVVVTGGAGFIGSHLVDELAKEGALITVIDDLSAGKKGFLSAHLGKKYFNFVKADLLSPKDYSHHFEGAHSVFHLAANSDIQKSAENTMTDLEQGVIATHNVLEAMRKNDVGNFAFSSSSAVYGEGLALPLKESDGPLRPISLYGAAKLAAEGLASAYAGTFGMTSVIFRFANITGPRSTHGVVFDFCKKLRSNPEKLDVLGDGNQAKSYVLASECAQAMVFGSKKLLDSSGGKTEILNIANCDWISVRDIAREVVLASGLPSVNIRYAGGTRGWAGDVPKVMLDGSRLAKLGWKPKLNSAQTIREAAKHVWVESGNPGRS